VDNGGVSGATSGVLNDFGLDQPASTVHNEAANWVKIGSGTGDDVYVGYADTLHSGDCADGGASGNCLPFTAGTTGVANIWDGSGGTSTAATYFLGHPTDIPGYSGTPTHCTFGTASTPSSQFDCWDAGAILIVNTEVPEPSTVLLVGTLIFGLIAISLRRARQGAAAA